MPPGRHPETMKICCPSQEDQDRDSVRVSDVGADPPARNARAGALIGPFGERALQDNLACSRGDRGIELFSEQSLMPLGGTRKR
jgi:hypothetical protein